MRLDDLLELPVFDQRGRHLGQVHDAHLVQDGPPLASNQAAFRLHGLLVGQADFATRLGYAREDGPSPRGPWPIRAVVERLHRDAVYVPWPAVQSVERDRIVVNAPPEGFRREKERESPRETT